MQTSAEGRTLIEAFEGLFLRTYKDSVGVLTIGYGHTTAAGPPIVKIGDIITEPQADDILSADLAAVEGNVSQCISIPLAQYEFDALVSFDFNTGSLHKSSIRTKINAGDKLGAMGILLLYDHAGGVVLSGLTRRRHAEKLLFESKIQPALDLAGSHKKLAPTSTGKAVPRPAPPLPPDVSPPDTEVPSGFWSTIFSIFTKGN
jgi:lysozyme